VHHFIFFQYSVHASLQQDPMLQALRKRAFRSFSIFFVASAALAVAMKKMFKDQFAEEDKEASEHQTRLEQQQQQQQRSGHSSDNHQSITSGRHESQSEKAHKEFEEYQEFKRFQEEKRLRNQQQASGVSESKAP
jgi:hypothetical protein